MRARARRRLAPPTDRRARRSLPLPPTSGLDNAGKTTVVKRLSGEPLDGVSPTLGFNIKTLEMDG